MYAEIERPPRVRTSFSFAFGSADGRFRRDLAVGRGVGEGPESTRPRGSRRLPLTSGLRPIPAVRMPSGEGVKSTQLRHWPCEFGASVT
jgi:hypothetical protein